MKKNKENIPISKIKEQTAELQSATASVFDKYAFQIAFGLIALIGFIIFKDYLLFNKMFLFKDIGSDTLNGSYPPMYHTAEYLHQYGLPSWSFSYGMGVNILPLWLRDPFDILLYIAGKDHIVQLIPYKEYLKVVLGGITFFMYLRLAVKDPFTCIVGSLLFAFSGFMIIGSCWYIFSYEAFNVALLLLAFEKLYQQNKGYLFPLSLAIIATSQPFNLYVYGLFLLIYTVLRYFEDGKNTSFKPLFILLGKMAGLGVLALLMSAIFLIPDIVQLLESPRGSGSSSYFDALSSKSMFGFEQSIHNKTFLSRLFSNDLMGTGINFKGWQNYLEAPIVYCGILSLVLLSQVFTSTEKKKKRYYLIFLLIFIIPVIFPYFRYAFWLFTGDYYRAFSFFVALAILYVGLQTLKSINIGAQKTNAIALGVGSLILLLVLASTTLDEIKSKTVFTIALFMIIAYTVSILLLPNAKYKRTIQYVLIFLLVIELSYMGYLPTNNRRAVTAQEMKQKVGYNDYSVEAV
ncbi:MAG TPA: YfhO family protein, partial [Bacteroidia bacterium]|nr:YfhO family protein [Bacteroidia bacterium]